MKISDKPNDDTKEKTLGKWRARIRKFTKWGCLTTGIILITTCTALGIGWKCCINPRPVEYAGASALMEDREVVKRIRHRVRENSKTKVVAREEQEESEEGRLIDDVAARLMDGFEREGIQYLQTLLRNIDGVYELIIALQDPEFFEMLKGLFVEEGARLGPDFIEDNILDSSSPLLEMLNDRNLRRNLALAMKMSEGRRFLHELAMTPEGDILLGLLFGSQGGSELALDLFSSEEGRETAEAVFDGMTQADPMTPQPELPSYEPTDYGEGFRAGFDSDEGIAQLIEDMRNEEYREELVEFFRTNTTEARGILRDAISTEEGRSRMVRLMVSDGGLQFMERLGEEGLGEQIGGEDIWQSADGRALVSELLETPEGRQAILVLLTGWGALSEALADALNSPSYDEDS